MLCSSACRTGRADPQQAFDHARLACIHGHLIAAHEEAHKNFLQYANSDPGWAWRFRLLDADILVQRGLNADVVSLLKELLPDALKGSDLDVRRHMELGIACFRLGRTKEADEELAQADRLCGLSCLPAGELARAHGVVEVDRDHLDMAESLFRKSLEIARQQHDQYLEATALLNLGVIAMREQRYDSSVDWSSKAQTVAHDLNAALTEEKALANLGWAYYKLGDFDKSEELFVEAGRRAKDMGAVRMIQDGMAKHPGVLVYYQKNQLSEAENNYQQSLQLAQQIQDPIEIAGAMSTLAFVSALKGQTAAANQYCEQALKLTRDSGDRPAELFVLLIKGQIDAKTGDAAQAEQLFRQVAEDPKSDVSLKWEAENSLALLYEEQGKTAMAEKEFRQAVATVEAARATLNDEGASCLSWRTPLTCMTTMFVSSLREGGPPRPCNWRTTAALRPSPRVWVCGSLHRQSRFRPSIRNKPLDE